jgi:serine/threonine protein kinase
MNYFRNPSVLALCGYFHDQHTFSVVMEFASFGSLSELLYNCTAEPAIFPIALCLGWCLDISRASELIHGKHVQHGDLKAENLLLFPGLKVKICDFGLSRQQNSCSMRMSKLWVQKHGAGTIAFIVAETEMVSVRNMGPTFSHLR